MRAPIWYHMRMKVRRYLYVIAVAMFAASPLLVRADELSETIRGVILADPRASSLSPDEIAGLVTRLNEEASGQGMTAHDILWRPTIVAADTVVDTPAQAEAASANRPMLIGVFIVIALACIAGYIELTHRRRSKTEELENLVR